MTRDVDRRDFETKYVFDNRRRHAVCRWLKCRCPPDPQHPVYVVKSIYFDTRSWRALNEKANSEFSKSKARLRWYADPLTSEPTGLIRLEVKRKRGGLRGKLRIPVDISPEELSTVDLGDPWYHAITDLLHAHGVDAASRLLPAFQIDYTRRRFVHLTTGAELCLDYDIHVPRVNRSMVFRHDPRVLRQAVFEVKGSATRLMPDLHFLFRLGCRKESFSKYLTCYRHVVGESD